MALMREEAVAKLADEAQNSDEINATVREIGMRIRLRRKVKRMTLAQLASATGISITQLSHIERGNTMPSIDKLVSLCNALDMHLNWLFASSSPDPSSVEANYVIRKNARRKLFYKQNGMLKEMLTPDSISDLQMMRMVLTPDGKTGDAPYNQDTGAKAGIVLQGELALELDGEVLIVGEGDSFAFEATRMMRFWANDVETEILWITSPAFY
ncbi:helix-turn-helix domain-containing protein [Aliihoeflea sp. PC F10.4]